MRSASIDKRLPDAPLTLAVKAVLDLFVEPDAHVVGLVAA
jgi:hypothetical protein